MYHASIKRAFSFIFLLGVSLLISACNDNKKKAVVEETPSVDVLTLYYQDLPVHIDLPGRVTPFRVAEVRPQVSGVILRRLFSEGSDVKTGQPLYQIDPAPFKASLANAHAALAQAQAAARIAGITWRRYHSLQGTNYISQQDIDEANANWQQKTAAVQVAKAAEKRAQINLNWSMVKSPIQGRISISNVTEGALVENGQSNVLTRVQQLDPIYIDVTQSSDDYLQLQKKITSGQVKQHDGKVPVQVIMKNGEPYAHTGRIQSSDVTVDPTTGSITLRAIVPNPDHQLMPGMFVRARLQQGTDSQSILIPHQSVTHNSRGDAQVLVVNDDDKVEVRLIDITEVPGHQWCVNRGLKVGERIILTGGQHVQPNMKVIPRTVASISKNAS
jgi:membrane fusion protein (multidrug efflux system)